LHGVVFNIFVGRSRGGCRTQSSTARHLFIALNRSANDATDYFQIPTGRVVEVGTQVTI
jgi:K+ transporter